MFDIDIIQTWLDVPDQNLFEQFKSGLIEVLNSIGADKNIGIASAPFGNVEVRDPRWFMSKTADGEAILYYDNAHIASVVQESQSLRIHTLGEEIVRYDDVMYSIRFMAYKLYLSVYSNLDNHSRLPSNYQLCFKSSYLVQNRVLKEFFEKINFTPLFSFETAETSKEGRKFFKAMPPFYVKNNDDSSIHIINDRMLDFLISKEDQTLSSEFSYKVADSIDDFSRKYDIGLVPRGFYQNFEKPVHIINETYFDVYDINRKVFIDPYIYDFDLDSGYKYFTDLKNGLHYMDKVRVGENFDEAVSRILREYGGLDGAYVGARVWGIEFDRDKENKLTPRLKVNIFVAGLSKYRKQKSTNWASLPKNG